MLLFFLPEMQNYVNTELKEVRLYSHLPSKWFPVICEKGYVI